jgi:hypothetical protein
MTLAGMMSVTGCSSNNTVTIEELQLRVSSSKEYRVDATWVWGEGKSTAVRMTGRGTWTDHGRLIDWQNRWNGLTTRSMIDDENVVTEDGESHSRKSIEGRYRLEADLFASADPLVLASGYGVKLSTSNGELTGRGDCATEHGPCTARLHVVVDREGRPEQVRLVVTHQGWTDHLRYVYKYPER